MPLAKYLFTFYFVVFVRLCNIFSGRNAINKLVHFVGQNMENSIYINNLFTQAVISSYCVALETKKFVYGTATLSCRYRRFNLSLDDVTESLNIISLRCKPGSSSKRSDYFKILRYWTSGWSQWQSFFIYGRCYIRISVRKPTLVIQVIMVSLSTSGYQLDDRGILFRFPAPLRDFTSVCPVRLWDQPGS